MFARSQRSLPLGSCCLQQRLWGLCPPLPSFLRGGLPVLPSSVSVSLNLSLPLHHFVPDLSPFVEADSSTNSVRNSTPLGSLSVPTQPAPKLDRQHQQPIRHQPTTHPPSLPHSRVRNRSLVRSRLPLLARRTVSNFVARLPPGFTPFHGYTIRLPVLACALLRRHAWSMPKLGCWLNASMTAASSNARLVYQLHPSLKQRRINLLIQVRQAILPYLYLCGLRSALLPATNTSRSLCFRFSLRDTCPGDLVALPDYSLARSVASFHSTAFFECDSVV